MDFEVIAVDDGSKEEERIEDLMDVFDFLKVVRIEPEDKWYFNSCIPFNIGISLAQGDIIVLQNPECLHVQDVLTYIANTTEDSNYITIATYAINEQMTKNLSERIEKNNFMQYFKSLPQQVANNYVGWYNHTEYRPVYFHFCVALTKKNMKALGGFDERYAYGTGYEDCDFVDRVNRLKLSKIISTAVFVIHQWHPVVYDINLPSIKVGWNRNCALHQVTKKENKIKAENSYV